MTESGRLPQTDRTVIHVNFAAKRIIREITPDEALNMHGRQVLHIPFEQQGLPPKLELIRNTIPITIFEHFSPDLPDQPA